MNLLAPQSSNRPGIVSPVVYEGPQFVIGSAEVSDSPNLEDLIERCSEQIDYLLVDIDSSGSDLHNVAQIALENNRRGQVILYSDSEVWLRATLRATRNLVAEMGCSDVHVVGRGQRAEKVREALPSGATDKSMNSRSQSDRADKTLFLLCENYVEDDLKEIQGGVVLCPVLDLLTREQVLEMAERGNLVIRLEMQRELHAELDAQINSANRASLAVIDHVIDGIQVVAGGRVGPRGSVVVDSVPMPSTAIGVADGRGQLLAEAELGEDDLNNLQIVRQRLARERV